MSENTADKTNIISTETFKGKLKAADDAPPAVVVLVGPAGYVGKQWLITKSDMTIGRSVETELYVSDSSLSRSHARFEISGNDIYILDLDSTNKTFVNGAALDAMIRKKLVNNDQYQT